MLYERQLRGGRMLLALFDPRMEERVAPHLWREKGRGGGELYTETGPQPGRTYLAHYTAEVCFLDGGRLDSLGLKVSSWAFKDGCPVNCLAANLAVELSPAGAAPPVLALESQPQQQARQAARAAMRQLYAAVGAAEGRRYLEALHREHQALQQKEQAAL